MTDERPTSVRAEARKLSLDHRPNDVTSPTNGNESKPWCASQNKTANKYVIEISW